MRGLVLFGLLALAATPFAAVPDDTPSPGRTIAITGGKVFPVSGQPIEHGTVVIANGTITAVGANVTVPADAERIDASGKWVTPGLVNAATSLGLVEVDAVDQTDDTTVKGERGVAAAVRAWDALNPDSELWAPARQDGLTNVVVLPSGGFVGGQAALVETLEGPVSEMVRKAPIGVMLDLGAREAAEAGARPELFARLRELLETARLYSAGAMSFDSAQLRALWPERTHVRALGPVVKGTLPLLAHADRAADLVAMLALAREYSVRIIFYGGSEAWKVAPQLAAAKVPVVVAGLANLPEGFDELGATLENAARLDRAGVQVVVAAIGENAFKARGLRQHAGNAVANGLSWDAALRAVTLTPAEVFGAGASIGSLQVGRDANVVVWDGDPFEFTTRAEHVFVRGRESTAPSREQLLVDRYRTRARPTP
jgi:imidazolonepropionase-like amidohydrolase